MSRAATSDLPPQQSWLYGQRGRSHDGLGAQGRPTFEDKHTSGVLQLHREHERLGVGENTRIGKHGGMRDKR